MTAVAIDDFLVRHVPGPRVVLSPAIPAARASLGRATEMLRAVPDASLEADWPWRGKNADVRYGFYRVLETLEEASVDIGRALRECEGMSGLRRTRAGDLAALATVARWDLHGRLAVLEDDVLDRDPGGGEWTLRQTLAHIVGGQRGYAWYSAWWLSQAVSDPDRLPPRVPETVDTELPAEETEGQGSIAEIRERLDDVLDGSGQAFGGLDETQLATWARWVGYPVTVAFRLGRWSSHMREHTVQVDKTLAAVGWAPREVDRLIGLIHGAFGALESVVYLAPLGSLVAPSEDGRTADAILGDALSAVEALASEVSASARTASATKA